MFLGNCRIVDNDPKLRIKNEGLRIWFHTILITLVFGVKIAFTSKKLKWGVWENY